MRYPVKLKPDSGGYVVSFPDIPEAHTQGDTREEALDAALDALITSFEFYFEDGEPIPLPGEVTDDFVDVPISVSAKVLLLNTYLSSGLTQVELSYRMGVSKQEIQRLFNLKHSTKIDTLNKALSALGKPLSVDYRDQLDIYQVVGAPDQLQNILKAGSEIKFAASTLTEPNKVRFYAATLLEEERLTASFVVAGNIREIEYDRAETIELSSKPVASSISKYTAFAVNCLLP